MKDETYEATLAALDARCAEIGRCGRDMNSDEQRRDRWARVEARRAMQDRSRCDSADRGAAT